MIIQASSAVNGTGVAYLFDSPESEPEAVQASKPVDEMGGSPPRPHYTGSGGPRQSSAMRHSHHSYKGALTHPGAAVGYAVEFKFPVASRAFGVKLPRVV